MIMAPMSAPRSPTPSFRWGIIARAPSSAGPSPRRRVHDFFNLMAVAILFRWSGPPVPFLRVVFLATAFAGLGGLQVGSPVKAATGPAVSALATAVGQQGTLLLVIAAALTVGALFSIVRLLRSLALRRVEAALDERLFRNAGAPCWSAWRSPWWSRAVQSPRP